MLVQARRTDRSSWFPVQCAGVAVAATVWIGCLLLSGDAEVRKTVSNLGLLAIAMTAAAQCIVKGQRARGRIRVAWRLFGAGCLSWGLGQLYWAWSENVWGREIPFPSRADIGYLAMVPLVVGGLLAMPTASKNLASRARAVLDGLTIASALLFISLATVLETVYRVDESRLEQVVGLAYPLADVVILTLLVLAFMRTRRLDLVPMPTLLLLSAGLVSFAISDSGFAYQNAKDAYFSGDLIDAGWFVGLGLIYLAACRPPLLLDEDSELDAVDKRSAVLLPYVAVVLAILTGGVTLLNEGHLDRRLGWVILVLASLILLRQVVILIENVSLTRNLEGRVRARTEELHRSEQRFRSLVQHSSDVTTLIGRDGVVMYQSSSGAQVFGHDPELLVGRNLVHVIHPDDREVVAAALETTAAEQSASRVVEFAILGPAGQWRQTETTITNMLDNPAVSGLVLNSRDVSERRSLQIELVHSAFHDPLTQLSNRRLFQSRLEQALAAEGQEGGAIAVLFLDLDDFKSINDSYGHAAGDVVLVEVAERLLDCVRVNDSVARLGGDEFAILLEGLGGRSEVSAVAERICESLRAPFRLGDREVFLGGSIGIAGLTEGADDTADNLLRNADLAMYQAKAEQIGSYRWYEPIMHLSVLRRLELDGDMRRAVERGELFLEYQPIIDLASGTVTGAEALVRWAHPVRGVVSPSDFIPVAEANGLIAAIGEWVVDEACRQLRQWQDRRSGPPLTMSVNLSGRQLDSGETADVVSDALERWGLDPAHLMLEVTESVFIGHTERTLGNLRSLKELGVRLAVDDFGTGYSNLSYLHRLPVDVIKIDKLFVDRLTAQPGEAGLAASIVRIGQDLHLVTVAEGVEHRFQLDVLRSIGCDQGQGNLLARPVRPTAFEALLDDDGRLVRSAGSRSDRS